MCRLVKLYEDKAINVADIKRDHILNMVECAKDCNEIDKILLFGSALESRCTKDSDIDVAIVGNLPRGRFNKPNGYLSFRERVYSYDFEQEYDMLYFKDILEDIASNGVVIYSKR